MVTPSRARRATACRAPRISLRRTLGEKLFGLADLDSVAVGIARELGQAAEIRRRLRRVTTHLGGLGRAVEAAQPLRRRLHRRLVFLQRGPTVALVAQHV